MKKPSVSASLLQWLNSIELFIQPVKLLPGKWRLYEYYTEQENKLINLKEEQLKKENQYWEINFEPQGHLTQTVNLPVECFMGITWRSWKVAGNFIALVGNGDPDVKEDFQFAIVKGVLKLLKKKPDGSILFFGFFTKMQEPLLK